MELRHTHHNHLVAEGEEDHVMDYVWPLGSHISPITLGSRKVRDVILGLEGIVHVEEVHHEIPSCYVTPGNQDGRPSIVRVVNTSHLQKPSMQHTLGARGLLGL